MRNWDWNKFITKTRNRKPVNYLTEAVKILGASKGKALDLGCGSGVDSKYLAEQGFQVEAIDSNKTGIIETRKLCKNLPVVAAEKNIVDYIIKPNAYQLIIAWNILPFLNKDESRAMLLNIQKGLKKGGVFVFSVFGPKDDWAKNHSEMSFWTKEELESLLTKMDFIKFSEEKQKKPGATGEVKFWHLVRGIAKKK